MTGRAAMTHDVSDEVSDTAGDDATAQQVAEAVRDAMWGSDRASRMLGMEVVAVGPGRATVTMTVREDMANGHGICHGGLVATLADSAFAFACNAYNEVTVASGFDVNLVAAARVGERLTAEASEVSRSGRTGVYDIRVSGAGGATLAVFRGRSHTMKGRAIVDGLPVGRQRPDAPREEG